MAHLGFTRTVYKSGSQGKAADRIAYITGRMSTPLDFATRQLVYLTQGREDLVKEGTGNLPAWAGGDAQTYFSAAEKYEGKDRVAFEEWKVSLPHELTREQNAALVDDLLDILAGTSLPYTYAFHEPRTLSDVKPQPHMHVLISARRTDEYARSAETHFKLWQAKSPERGGAQKDPTMNTQGAVKMHRLMISDMLNMHLELNGQVARVHPDSLKARGIQRPPEPKMSPGESRAYREQGVKSRRVQRVLDIRQERAAQPPHEQNNARQYWEGRKAFLGLSRDMPRGEQVARLLALRHGTAMPGPVRSPAAKAPHVSRAGQAMSEEALDKVWSKPLIGNRLSQIYHTPEHLNYGDVNPKNQVRFWTERAAQAAGYRRARNEHYGRGTGVLRTEQTRSRQGPQRQAMQQTRSVRQHMQQLAAHLDRAEERGSGHMRVKLHEEHEWD